jgi:hypothetical protein
MERDIPKKAAAFFAKDHACSSPSSRRRRPASPSRCSAACGRCRRRPASGLVHHSDRGPQYISDQYGAVLAQHGIVMSLSRRGIAGTRRWPRASSPPSRSSSSTSARG